MMKKLVVFDLDGTLNKTDLYAVSAHQKAMKECGASIKSPKLIISTFGERGEDVYHLLADTDDEARGKAYLHRVGEFEREFISEHHGEYDGVTEMLKTLKAHGFYTAICSNSSERYIKMVLTYLNILQYIDYIQPLVPNKTKDETLLMLIERESPDKTVMVGDRKFDKAAARANNVPFIGCLYGFDGVKAFEVEDADVTVDSPAEIVKAAEKLTENA